MRETTEPTMDKWGAEVHPSFGMIRAARVTGGTSLFQSDLMHQHFVIVEISRASRKRDLNSDWVHSGEELIEVAMSEAQWASFVSSMNTSGVPCTITSTIEDRLVPQAPFSPRMAESMKEVTDAADAAFERAKDAFAKYEEALATGGAKEKREALRTLKYALENSEANVEFAGKKLAQHAENVVQKARADIEAMVTNKAVQLGLTTAEAAGLLALPVMPTPAPRELETGEPV